MPKFESERPSVPKNTVRERVLHATSAVRGSAPEDSGLDAPSRAKLLLVDFRSGEAVQQHPEIASFVKDGWLVTGAAPRVTQDGTRLLVVLAPPGSLAGVSARQQYSDQQRSDS